ncbi:hypothetical protein ACIRVK_38825 [Streptomyces sp. NPDC101152]|uniref:hypothetical protein n=1 Tax=Streptomyces sp. NPDC101152 TaxID=3366116 RepID=UPI0038119849
MSNLRPPTDMGRMDGALRTLQNAERARVTLAAWTVWEVPGQRTLLTMTSVLFGEFQYPTPPLGTSDSGFRDEVEAEQAIARGQLLAEMGADEDRPTLAGPAGAEAERRLAEFARHTAFDGQVVTDEARLRRIVARHDPHMYLGTFVTCVYNPDRALCRTPKDPGDGQPVLAECQPLTCRNTALTSANRQALNGHLTKLEEALTNRDRLAPYVRHRLEEQHRETAAFLARHAPETTE